MAETGGSEKPDHDNAPADASVKEFPVLKSVLLAMFLAAPLSVALGDAPGKMHKYESLALAPDGLRLASVEPIIAGMTEAEPRGPIVVRSVQDGQVIERLDPCPHCRYSGLAWSPDSTQLAFLAADEQSKTVRIERVNVAVMAAPAKSSAAVTLSTVKGVASSTQWSPDGSKLALLVTVDAKKKSGALEAGAPQVGEIGSTPDEQRIAVLPAAGGALKLVSADDTYVYEYDWTADGGGFVAITAKGDGDDNWWVAELDAIDLTSGHSRMIAHPDFQISMPRAAPDGKSVQFIGGLMSDFGAVGGEVYQVAIEGGTPVSRTPGFRGSFRSLTWRGGHLYAAAIVVDQSALLQLDDAARPPRTLWSAPVSAKNNDFSAGEVDTVIALSADANRAATVVEDFAHAPMIMAGPTTAMRQITHDNDALDAAVDVSSVSWTSDGYNVQGWLVGPREPAAGKRYPMIVQIHGGPSWANLPYFGSDFDFETPPRAWVARGYYVFLPNPRGSYGQGELFTKANVRDFGGGDLRDVLAGVDTVLKLAPVDDARLGVFGHSYGGFMTMWTVTHSNRFKAAIAGAGIANWISYYGENGIDQWMIPFFGASAYDDPAVYRAASPIESIKQAQTPTFIYVGELDVECPAPQSFEFWHGLKAMGVPTQMVVYPGTGHWIHKPAQVADLRRRVVDWFDHYLTP
jgi:dipeptidyl aminopeptidase/acylaminoacyl peptidase